MVSQIYFTEYKMLFVPLQREENSMEKLFLSILSIFYFYEFVIAKN